MKLEVWKLCLCGESPRKISFLSIETLIKKVEYFINRPYRLDKDFFEQLICIFVSQSNHLKLVGLRNVSAAFYLFLSCYLFIKCFFQQIESILLKKASGRLSCFFEKRLVTGKFSFTPSKIWSIHTHKFLLLLRGLFKIILNCLLIDYLFLIKCIGFCTR